MKVIIEGTHSSCKVIRGQLSRSKVAFVVEEPPKNTRLPFFTVHIERHKADYILLDSVDSELERNILNRIADHTKGPIAVQRFGGIQSDREIRIKIPDNQDQEEAVELGVVTGILQTITANNGAPPPEQLIPPPANTKSAASKATKKVKKIAAAVVGFFAVLFIVLLLSGFIHAQQTPTGSAVFRFDLTRIGGASVSSTLYDSGNFALRVNCVVGCGGGGAGTEYTEGDTDASITGKAFMMEGAANTLLPVQGTIADGLLVNLGANNDVTVTGTVTTAISQAGTDNNVDANITNASLAVTATDLDIRDLSSASDSVSAVVTSLPNEGQQTMANSISVAIASNQSAVSISGTVTADAGSGTFTVGDGGGSLTVDNATLSVVGGGTEATALRVTVANDSTGVLSVDDNGGSLTVDGTVGVSGTITVAGNKTNNNAAPGATNVGALTALANAAAPSWTEGNLVALSTDLTGALRVTGASGGVSHIDDAAFTAATDDVVPIAGMFDDASVDSVDEDDAGVVRMSANRNLYSTIRDAAGNERGANVTAANALKVDNSAVTQPVSGTVTVTATDLDIRDLTSVSDSVSAVITSLPNEGQQTMANSISVAIASNQSTLLVDGSAVTQPVSGTVTANAGSGTFTTSDTATLVDDAAFTPDTSRVMMSGAEFDDTTPDSVNEGDAGAVRMSANRNLYTTLRDAAGNERGANVTAGNALVVDGSASTQPVSGTVTVTDGAGALNVIVDSGSITVSDGAGALTVDGTVAVSSITTSVTPGTAAANLGKAEDVASADADVGVASFAIRDDTLNIRSGTEGDWEPLHTNASGALWVDGSTVTQPVSSTNLDIRDLTSVSDSVTVTDGSGALNVIVDSGSVTVSDGAGALNVIVDSGTITSIGTSVTPGSGATNLGKAEDGASADLDVGVGMLAVRKATPGNTSGADGDYEFLQMSAGRLWTSATIDAALPAGTNAIGKLAANSGVDIGDVDVTSVIPGTGGTNLGKAEDAAHTDADTGIQMLAVRDDTLNIRSGAENDYEPLHTNASGALYVAQNGELPAGTQNIGDVDIASMPNEGQQTAANSISVTPDTDNDAIQANGSSATGIEVVQTGGTDGTNIAAFYVDPCQREAKTYFVVNVASAATTEIANQVSGEFFYICSINLVASAADNVVIVEDDTDACASPTAGLNGGTTAATGWNFAANSGIVIGNGSSTVMKTATANRYFCFITSSSAQLSGTIAYVSAP